MLCAERGISSADIALMQRRYVQQTDAPDALVYGLEFGLLGAGKRGRRIRRQERACLVTVAAYDAALYSFIGLRGFERLEGEPKFIGGEALRQLPARTRDIERLAFSEVGCICAVQQR